MRNHPNFYKLQEELSKEPAGNGCNPTITREPTEIWDATYPDRKTTIGQSLLKFMSKQELHLYIKSPHKVRVHVKMQLWYWQRNQPSLACKMVCKLADLCKEHGSFQQFREPPPQRVPVQFDHLQILQWWCQKSTLWSPLLGFSLPQIAPAIAVSTLSNVRIAYICS